jgi:hypothetical protein
MFTMKHLRAKWPDLTDREKREAEREVQYMVPRILRDVVRVVAHHDFPHVVMVNGGIGKKPGEPVKLALTTTAHVDLNLLSEAKSVMVLIADPEEFGVRADEVRSSLSEGAAASSQLDIEEAIAEAPDDVSHETQAALLALADRYDALGAAEKAKAVRAMAKYPGLELRNDPDAEIARITRDVEAREQSRPVGKDRIAVEHPTTLEEAMRAVVDIGVFTKENLDELRAIPDADLEAAIASGEEHDGWHPLELQAEKLRRAGADADGVIQECAYTTLDDALKAAGHECTGEPAGASHQEAATAGQGEGAEDQPAASSDAKHYFKAIADDGTIFLRASSRPGFIGATPNGGEPPYGASWSRKAGIGTMTATAIDRVEFRELEKLAKAGGKVKPADPAKPPIGTSGDPDLDASIDAARGEELPEGPVGKTHTGNLAKPFSEQLREENEASKHLTRRAPSPVDEASEL